MGVALISFAVTAKLICACLFAYAKNRFSHDMSHMLLVHVSIRIAVPDKIIYWGYPCYTRLIKLGFGEVTVIKYIKELTVTSMQPE